MPQFRPRYGLLCDLAEMGFTRSIFLGYTIDIAIIRILLVNKIIKTHKAIWFNQLSKTQPHAKYMIYFGKQIWISNLEV